ncbi:MAG: FtsW/RodA/SpoVE family cell cycle protein [Oscillospiraceae bacterium]|nr:FtsW/RodA/SpoVE family cell cycle protein [Oscillospiraceae bacterium]
MTSRTGVAPGNANIRVERKNRTKTKESNSAGKIKTGPMDLPFFITLMILLVIGIIMMFSAGYAWAIAKGNAGTFYVERQLFTAGLGLVGMFIASFIDYHRFRKAWIAYGSFIASIILLILCRVGPFTAPRGEAHRWVQFHSALPTIQPSEFVKLSIILLFAYLISNNYNKMKSFKQGVVPFLVILGVISFLMMIQPHLSGTLIICSIGIIMMYVGGTRASHLIFLAVIGIVLVAVGVIVLMNFAGFNYFEKRWISWTDPFNTDTNRDDVWQTRNSLIAIGSGGLFGLGLGNSRQKFLYLPESQNDFVFAVVCEELGFVGAVVIIILFLLLIMRGFYIAAKAPDKFGMMLAVGLVAQIGIQALLNIAVVTNTIPNTGVSLPFFSYGGTALALQLLQMGVVLNISRQSIIEV